MDITDYISRFTGLTIWMFFLVSILGGFFGVGYGIYKEIYKDSPDDNGIKSIFWGLVSFISGFLIIGLYKFVTDSASVTKDDIYTYIDTAAGDSFFVTMLSSLYGLVVWTTIIFTIAMGIVGMVISLQRLYFSEGRYESKGNYKTLMWSFAIFMFAILITGLKKFVVDGGEVLSPDKVTAKLSALDSAGMPNFVALFKSSIKVLVWLFHYGIMVLGFVISAVGFFMGVNMPRDDEVVGRSWKFIVWGFILFISSFLIMGLIEYIEKATGKQIL